MTRRPGRPPADAGRIVAAYRAGRPVAWICARLGVSQAAVYRILARAGVERDGRPGGPRAPRAPPAQGPITALMFGGSGSQRLEGS